MPGAAEFLTELTAVAGPRYLLSSEGAGLSVPVDLVRMTCDNAGRCGVLSGNSTPWQLARVPLSRTAGRGPLLCLGTGYAALDMLRCGVWTYTPWQLARVGCTVWRGPVFVPVGCIELYKRAVT